MALQDLTPQLRTRLRRVEKIVGLFVTLAALILLIGFAYYLYHTAARKGWFIPHCPYHTYAMSGEGLLVGDPVYLMGFEVGEITEITAQPPGSWYKVYVGFQIRQPYYGYVWSDSKVKIMPAGFLGARRLEVTTGFNGKPTAYDKNDRLAEVLVDGKRVPIAQVKRGPHVAALEDPSVTERAEKLLNTVEAALPNILAITNRLNTALDNTSALLTNSTTLVANLDRTITGVQPAVSNLTVITGHLTDPSGSLGEWLLPTNINAETHALLTNLNIQLTATLMNVADITSNLNAQVLANDQILAEISRLVVDTDNLVQGLKKHWLLRGVFKETPGKTNTTTNVKTNAPATNFSPVRK